jgi:curved DNA-binding protein CbpA
MNPWKILKISKTSSVKEIKRAYARELKVTKPDENPKEFQVLYEAYQSALRLAETVESNPVLLQSHDQVQQSVDQPVEDESRPVDQSSDSELNAEFEQQITLRQEEYNRLMIEVKRLLDAHEVGQSLNPWNFLASSEYILEDRFNQFVGISTFKLFVDYLQQKKRSRGRYYSQHIYRDLLVYCDQLFSWSNNLQYLRSEFGEGPADKILNQLIDEGASVFNMGLRGGTLVKSDSPKALQKSQQETSSAIITLLQFLFLMAVLGNIFKHAIEK